MPFCQAASSINALKKVNPWIMSSSPLIMLLAVYLQSVWVHLACSWSLLSVGVLHYRLTFLAAILATASAAYGKCVGFVALSSGIWLWALSMMKCTATGLTVSLITTVGGVYCFSVKQRNYWKEKCLVWNIWTCLPQLSALCWEADVSTEHYRINFMWQSYFLFKFWFLGRIHCWNMNTGSSH